MYNKIIQKHCQPLIEEVYNNITERDFNNCSNYKEIFLRYIDKERIYIERPESENYKYFGFDDGYFYQNLSVWGEPYMLYGFCGNEDENYYFYTSTYRYLESGDWKDELLNKIDEKTLRKYYNLNNGYFKDDSQFFSIILAHILKLDAVIIDKIAKPYDCFKSNHNDYFKILRNHIINNIENEYFVEIDNKTYKANIVIYDGYKYIQPEGLNKKYIIQLQ